jgi:dihydroxyacid dehydratase/phosphogluconate dehydratase
MMTGSSLIKVRPNSRQYHRFFTLAEDLNAIRWTPTSKKSSKAIGKKTTCHINVAQEQIQRPETAISHDLNCMIYGHMHLIHIYVYVFFNVTYEECAENEIYTAKVPDTMTLDELF